MFRIELLVKKGYNYYTRGCAYEYISNKYIFVRKGFALVLSGSARKGFDLVLSGSELF